MLTLPNRRDAHCALFAGAGSLSFSITGQSSGTSDADTTGSAIFLFKVSLKFKSSVAAGTYDGATLNLSPRAETLANTGGFAFVSATRGTQQGVVFDRRDGVQAQGQMVVEAYVDRGIFAYMPAPVLLNTARLGLAATTATPLVYAISSGGPITSTRATVPPTACSLSAFEPFSALANILTLSSSCEVSMTQLQTGSASAIPLSVSYGSLTTDLTFGVYSPAGLKITAADPTLNRIQDASGQLFESCTTGGLLGAPRRYPYQSTTLQASTSLNLPHGDFEVDITNLVTFTSTSSAVAHAGSAAGSAIKDWNVLTGKSVGTTTMLLGASVNPTDAPGAGVPSVEITVSDSPVHAVSMVARVVTTVSWISTPATLVSYGANVSVGVLLQQLLRAEGDSGLLFSQVSWSDGASEDVGITPISGLDEMTLTSSSSNIVLHAPNSASNLESFWKVEVAVAASAECISDQVAAPPSASGDAFTPT